MGWKTIQAGQAAVIWSLNGEGELVKGPRRMYLFRKRIQYCSDYCANQNQYLNIKFKDGNVRNVRGPAQEFLNPMIHTSIAVKDAISLTAHDVLVVYRPSPMPAATDDEQVNKQQGYTATVNRILIHGPSMHVPEPDEWFHEFVWHGTDRDNKTRKVPKGLQFTKLRVIPDQFYYNISDVRTADDALITVKVMVFFELVNIELMLETTHDPIADFINSICADVIAFSATRTYEAFLSQTGDLNKLETYPQLVQRSERMGYHISKVVYRGYHASDKLQRMMDSAIEARTSLRLEADTEEQSQQLADMKLHKELERSEKRREMERAQKEHEQLLERMEHEQAMEQARKKTEADLDFEKKMNAEKVSYLRALAEQNIDLTRYLVAQYQNPDKVLKIDMGASGGSVNRQGPAIHFHEDSI